LILACYLFNKGAYGSDPGTGESAGSAYVINGDDNGKNWLVVQKLVASDSDQSAFFGREVAIRNGTMVIGADGDSEAGTFYLENDCIISL
jgi:hypothetical protein